jgi:hypothetical protein
MTKPHQDVPADGDNSESDAAVDLACQIVKTVIGTLILAFIAYTMYTVVAKPRRMWEPAPDL